MQNILMKFDPATGKERPYPSHAAQWRNWHGVAAWLFDPWTGKRRNAYDVGSDVHGLLIVPAGTLGGDTGCGTSKQNKHEAGEVTYIIPAEYLDQSKEIESLRTTISRLREYARHNTRCEKVRFHGARRCDCGYDELMKELGDEI